MNYLSPSVLAADFGNLYADCAAAVSNGARCLHIDVMDGVFVPNISMGFPVIESLRPRLDCVFDVHLMITEPERYIERFSESGADIITFHAESTKDIGAVIGLIHGCSKKAGLSVKPGTDIKSIEKYLPYLDMVLVMTVEPGFGGQSYISYCTEKIRKLKEMIERQGLKTDIQVDGGINLDNVEMVMDAGANIIVAGSAVFKGDVEQNVQEFLNRMK